MPRLPGVGHNSVTVSLEGFAAADDAQGVLPPQQRPDIGALRDLGFSGSNMKCWHAPLVRPHSCCGSSMWTANAGTITPSMDAPDSRVHFTPANLQSSFHRYLEPQTTGRVLQATFRDEQHFSQHP
ncbi:N-succinylarginine dihydrolase [Halomonas alkaliantarctica]|uniref:N-succinylarginine dihydrolase n=1 Tax=Halomonas alkaliantarctica TaxID=232346 RepID=UPI003134459A